MFEQRRVRTAWVVGGEKEKFAKKVSDFVGELIEKEYIWSDLED